MKPATVLLLVAALIVGVVAFFGGRALRPSEAPGFASGYTAPAYAAAPTLAGWSLGGFSGFGETPGLEGRTVLSGRIVAVTNASVTVETVAGTQTLRLTGDRPLLRLEPANRDALRRGTTVVVRTDEADPDLAEAVLIVAQP